MKFNNGYEKKKFEKQWEQLREEYRAAGMEEEAIQSMYEYDLEQYNHRRRFCEHNQYLITGNPLASMEEDICTLYMNKYKDKFISNDKSLSEMDGLNWIEEIEDRETYYYLKNLAQDNLKILSLYIMEDYSQEEIAAMIGISRSSVRDRLKRMKANLKKYFLTTPTDPFSSAM